MPLPKLDVLKNTISMECVTAVFCLKKNYSIHTTFIVNDKKNDTFRTDISTCAEVAFNDMLY